MKTRRDFIKISALSAGGLALAGSTAKIGLGLDVVGTRSRKKKKGEVKLVPTYCEVCFWKCAGWAHVRDGVIEKITGNDLDPQCNGRLCPRGTGGVGMVYDKDRLKKPLIREERNGEQTYREASWDEALSFIAGKMQEIAAKHGPESIALFNHGTPGKHFTNLLKAFGSTTAAAPSFAQCRGAREVGFETTIGSSIGSPENTDIRDTRCLVLIGSHLGENMHNGQVQEMSEAIDKGTTIITVDPRFSTVAAKSKYWLPIKPATDMALLLSWIHVLIYEEWYNKDYVSMHTTGLDRLKAEVAKYTPEWAYGITNIAPDQIRKTAKEMADAAPAVIVHPGRHVSWYGDDAQRLRAVAIVNALLGSWGARGGFFMKEAVSMPEFPTPESPKPAWSWKELHGERFLFARESITNVLIEASTSDWKQPNRIYGWFVAGTNLPMAIPLHKELAKAVQELELIVVVDTMPTEVTGYADVVLPEATYLERYDELRNGPHREPCLALRMPVIEPMYDSKPGWWIAKQLAEKLGLGSYFNYTDYKEVLDWQLKQIGHSLAEIEQKGVLMFDRKTPAYLDVESPIGFKTPSGKIELYSDQLAAAGFDPVPVYKPLPEPQEGYYRLIYGRAPMHTFSRTANNPNLTDLMEENTVWVNPRVAGLWGLKAGQPVYLKNQDGVVSDFPIKVRITERIRWDSIYMVHGFGHNHKMLTQAHGKGANDTQLITNVLIDPMMGSTGMRQNFVTFVLNNNESDKEVLV